MQSSVTANTTPAIGVLLQPPARKWSEIARNWTGIAISLAILVAVAIKTQGIDFAKIVAVAPGWSLFWPTFLLFYFLVPAAHWGIYRRIWRLPAGGVVPLLRKQIANELILGYSGEAQFYLWARQHAGLKGSPFGAIKDVSVMSAVAGNIATLLLMVAMAPALASFMRGPLATTFALSIAVIVVFSLLPFLFRGQLFSLSARELRFVFLVHMMRIAVWLILSAAMWHFILPDIAAGTWLTLVTLRMMVSRLPLVANKDILFAAAAILLLGKSTDISAAVAFTAGLSLVAHLAVGAATAAASFIERRRAV